MAQLPPASQRVERSFGPVENRETARLLARDLGVALAYRRHSHAVVPPGPDGDEPPAAPRP